jgi:hypothetical protein
MTLDEKEQAIYEKYAGKCSLYDFASMMGELKDAGILSDRMGDYASFSFMNMMRRELLYRYCSNATDDLMYMSNQEWADIIYRPNEAQRFVQGLKDSLKSVTFKNWNFDIRGMLDSAIDDLLSMLDKSVESAHAAVERAVQAGLEQSGYMKFGDRMIPLNIM